jgi:hypothetical protein
MGLFSFFSSAKAKDSSESPHLVQQAIDLSDKGDYEAGDSKRDNFASNRTINPFQQETAMGLFASHGIGSPS